MLTRSELAGLTTTRPARVVCDTLFQWALILAAWYLAASTTSMAAKAACVVMVGTRFYALYIIGHDGLHRRLFARVGLNDFWSDAFVLAPIGAITRLNRSNHMTHHRRCGAPDDPDRYKYEGRGDDGSLNLLIGLTGLPFVIRAVANVFRRSPSRASGAAASQARSADAAQAAYTWRDLTILLSVNGVLIGGLTVTFGWYGYLVFWLVPVYLFTFSADLLRVYLEHSLLPGEDCPQRLVTIESHWFERQWIAPMNMNCHVVHHLYPAIPYHRLKEADRLLRSREHRVPGILRRRGYLRRLTANLRACRP